MPNNFDVLNSIPPLLIGESAKEFERLRAEFEDEIKPQGVIEKFYVNEAVSILWEILRLRRFKVAIIRIGRRRALESILMRIDPMNVKILGDKTEAQRLAHGWLEKDGDEETVEMLFKRTQLDEGAIDAQAFRHAYAEVEKIDNMLMSLESRFSKALQRLAKYRKTLALQVRASADRILERIDPPDPANDQSEAA